MIIYTDGASHGNPGPAGAGVYIEDSGQVLRQYLGIKTNNEAEYLALMLGLRYAQRKEASRLFARSDSMLLINQIRGDWQAKNKRLASLKHEALQLAKRFQVFGLSYVPRELNREADKAATEAANKK